MAPARKLIKILDRFRGKKIGVIGDLILDHFIWGDTERISPEAPIPVVLVSQENLTPGGAGNVAANITSLGGKSFLSGVVGKDLSGVMLLAELKKRKIDTRGIAQINHKATIKKSRVIARSQQVVRIDREEPIYIKKGTERKLIDYIAKNIASWHVMVFSDYVKGTVNKSLIKAIIKLAQKHRKPTIVDTKPKHASYFKNITLLTPNRSEAIEIGHKESIIEAGKAIQEKLNCQVLVTEGAEGMTLFEKDKHIHLPTKAKEVFDVAGAGDTVVAVLALSIASGASLRQSAEIANHAAGIVVGKIGIATVSLDELREDMLGVGAG